MNSEDVKNAMIGIATVGQVIKHLSENFKPTDKICYMDCVEGYKNDCTYVTKEQLGRRFFYTVKSLKEEASRANGTTIEQEDIYPFVEDNDVIVC